MNWIETLTLLIPLLGAGGIGGYFMGRKRTKLENQGLEAQNVGENLELYQKMIDDLEGRFNKRIIEQENYYEKKIKLLSQRISQLKQDLNDCKKAYQK